MPVEKGKREELARITGIHANDLSALNTGGRAMTIEMATRIAGAVEGVTVLDLGAPEAAASEEDAVLLSDLRRRLARAEAEVDWLLDVAERLALVAKVKLPPRVQPGDARSGGAAL